MPQATELLQATPDMLVLRSLPIEIMHGRDGARRIQVCNRKAKYYSLTAAGKMQLKAELATWDQLSPAIASPPGRATEALS